jgi:hypothetical protein
MVGIDQFLTQRRNAWRHVRSIRLFLYNASRKIADPGYGNFWMAKRKTGWDLMEAGELARALDLLKEEHRRDPFKGSSNNIGICYLCLNDGEAAKSTFDESIAQYGPDRGTHALAGIARWILGKRDEAIQVWLAGLDCDYRDAAGGMELPLLLFYAAALQPEDFAMRRAKKLVKEALKSSWASNWPGPLGRFVLREIYEKQVTDEARFDQPLVEHQQMNQVEFYAGVLAHLDGHEKEFKRRTQRCASAKGCELNNEWYLARYENRTRK